MSVKATTNLQRRTKGNGFEELKKRTKSSGTKVGFVKGLGAHPDGNGVTVAFVAAMNEFGTEVDGKEVVPARPFIRSTLREKKLIYVQVTKELLQQIVNGKVTADNAVKVLGEKVVLDIQNKIVEISEPANAESTAKAKGANNPLIGKTGVMRKSVTYEVVKK